MTGWIKVNRSLLDHWLWKDKPFSKGQAFIDLLLLAEYEDTTVASNGKTIPINRGSIFHSIDFYAKRWGWSEGKVRRFFDTMDKDGISTRNSTIDGTIVTIEKYDIYQGGGTTDSTTDSTTHGTTDGTTDGTTNGTTIKEIKNKEIKNKENNNKARTRVYTREERHKYGRYKNVLLSDSDLEKLKSEFPDDYERRIEVLSEYMQSHGKTYKDYLATIRNWDRMDRERSAQAPRYETLEEQQERRWAEFFERHKEDFAEEA